MRFFFGLILLFANVSSSSLHAQTSAPKPPEVQEMDDKDPYGFITWLNGYRAQHRLPAVEHDPELSKWAAYNNQIQLSRGMGHHVMGPARRQNVGWTPGGLQSVVSQWILSPGHNAALLDPSIRNVGISANQEKTGWRNVYWTYDAN